MKNLKMFSKFNAMISGGTSVALATLYFKSSGNFGYYYPISIAFGTVSAIIFGISVSLILYVKFSSVHKVIVKLPKEIYMLQSLSLLPELNQTEDNANQEIIITRKMDSNLRELLDSFISMNILPWFSPLVLDHVKSTDTLKEVLWSVLYNVYKKLSKIDESHLIMSGFLTCVTQHLEKIRIAQEAGALRGERGIFNLSSQLSSPDRERKFLRLVSNFFIMKYFPLEYKKCSILKVMLQEFIACKVLEPLIDRVSDPDWINYQLSKFLRQQQVARELSSKSYEELSSKDYHQAASFEDFIHLIRACDDLVELGHLRSNIVNDIMQATAINNLKRAKGFDLCKENNAQNLKGDVLQARNLKRYLNQLTYAKAQCDRRIFAIQNKVSAPVAGTEGECGSSTRNSLEKIDQISEELDSKVLTFQTLLESPFTRSYLSIHLEELGEGSLLNFWGAVQELKLAEKKLHYQLGMEIYHTYLASGCPVIKIDRNQLKEVESFLLGNRGPEILYEVMNDVEKYIEDEHYAGFLISSTYHAMLLEAQNQEMDLLSSLDEDAAILGSSGDLSLEPGALIGLSDHSNYARNKLAHLKGRLTNKMLALEAIEHSKNKDSKVIEHLKKEIRNIKIEYSQLESHIERTTIWSENIGQWRVLVCNRCVTDKIRLDSDKNQSVRPVTDKKKSLTDKSGLMTEKNLPLSDKSKSSLEKNKQASSEKDSVSFVLFTYLKSDSDYVNSEDFLTKFIDKRFIPEDLDSDWQISPKDCDVTADLDTDWPVLNKSNDVAVDRSKSNESDDVIGQNVEGMNVIGWIVNVKLCDVIDLHKKLCQIASWVKLLELPIGVSKTLFSKPLDEEQLERMRIQTQKYFDAILCDEKLQASELIYAFLSSSPEHLKKIGVQEAVSAKKSKFSLSSIFKSEGKLDNDMESGVGLITSENSNSIDSVSIVDQSTQNIIVEPLFDFLEELCDLRGVGKWLRKTLVTFVHVAYGKNINRHIREVIQGVFTEPMLLYYLQILRTSLYHLEDDSKNSRTQEEVFRTRREAHDLCVRNIPDLLCTLVGQQNAGKGAEKLFCTLQHHALNKNLIYTILDVFLKEIHSELRDD